MVGVTWYGTASSPGTFGQGGNAWEWNDAVISGSSRGLRGGTWSLSDSGLASSRRTGSDPSNGGRNFGFRVASVPEPTTVMLTILASGVLVTRRKR